jgi:hypothetical protein
MFDHLDYRVWLYMLIHADTHAALKRTLSSLVPALVK